MLALYQAADVVLDTYPASSYLTSLQVRSRFAALEEEMFAPQARKLKHIHASLRLSRSAKEKEFSDLQNCT